jgi:hypothetical protein
MKSDTSSSTNIIDYSVEIINATVAPNPFNEVTSLRYNLPGNSFVKAELISVTGSECMLLFAEHQIAGSYEIPINCKNMAPGFYILKLTVNNKSIFIKLILTD